MTTSHIQGDAGNFRDDRRIALRVHVDVRVTRRTSDIRSEPSQSLIERGRVYRDNRVNGQTTYSDRAKDESAVTASSRVETTTVEKTTDRPAAT